MRIKVDERKASSFVIVDSETPGVIAAVSSYFGLKSSLVNDVVLSYTRV